MSKVLHPHLNVIAALALAASLWAPTSASATDGELTLGLGPGYTDLPTLGTAGQEGFGGGLYAEYRLNSFWGLSAGTYFSYHLSEAEDELPGQRINTLWAGAIYNLDVFTYVPFFSVALTGYLADPVLEDPDGKAVNLGAKVGFGADWRRWRDWSFGVEFNLHAFITDLETYPVYITTLLRFNYHLEL